MREGTRQWKQMTRNVLALLNELDPCGLEPGRPDGAPADEYELEAGPIARNLLKEGVINLDTVDEIWHHWFDETLTEAVGASDAARLVESLNALVSQAPPSGDVP